MSKNVLPSRVGSRLQPKGFSLVIRSAESSRMTGLRHLPVAEREKAIRTMLDSAR